RQEPVRQREAKDPLGGDSDFTGQERDVLEFLVLFQLHYGHAFQKRLDFARDLLELRNRRRYFFRDGQIHFRDWRGVKQHGRGDEQRAVFGGGFEDQIGGALFGIAKLIGGISDLETPVFAGENLPQRLFVS